MLYEVITAHRQAQARPLPLGGEEGLEDPTLRFRCKARSRVLDLGDDVVARAGGPDDDGPACQVTRPSDVISIASTSAVVTSAQRCRCTNFWVR